MAGARRLTMVMAMVCRLIMFCGTVSSFTVIPKSPCSITTTLPVLTRNKARLALQKNPGDDDIKPSIIAKPLEPSETILSTTTAKTDSSEKEEATTLATEKAATNTINERLLQELQQQQDTITKGPQSALGKKLGASFVRPRKSEEEIQASIEEARNLNGVNPVVALTASFVAMGIAYGLWTFTNYVGGVFVSHPLETDNYAIQRVASVFRNVVMGMFSLLSGFFGVTGFGVFLLGVRVAYGVVTGELDPTPIKKMKRGGLEEDKVEVPNVWDFMTNKKPGRRR